MVKKGVTNLEVWDHMGHFPFIIDIIALLNIFFFLFMESLSLCFSFDLPKNIYTPAYSISLIFFSVEFILRFNIGYYHLGKAVKDRIKIFNKRK